MISCDDDFVLVAQAVEPCQSSLDFLDASRLRQVAGMNEKIAMRYLWLSIMGVRDTYDLIVFWLALIVC